MKTKVSLAYRFSALLVLFVSLTAGVLYFLIQAKDQPIAFAKQELNGSAYQRPLERLLELLSRHRILSQRVLNGDKQSQSQLSDVQAAIDVSITAVEAVDKRLGEALLFTDKGLESRKHSEYRISTVSKDWSSLKAKALGLKTQESNDLNTRLIANIRNMITHLGETSNLARDPDLDSYYLIDLTLNALPRVQEQIESVIVDLEPSLSKRAITSDDRLKASLYVTAMTEGDLKPIANDFQTVLSENPNFYGASPTLEPKLTPAHEKFSSAYKELIDLLKLVASGKIEGVERFNAVAEKALSASYEYSLVGSLEQDALLTRRISSIQSSKRRNTILSVLVLLLCLTIAWLFMKNLIQSMHQIMGVLNQSSHRLSGASGIGAASANQLSEASTEQAASLQETMASVEEISAMVSQNAESATKTKNVVDVNQRVSEEGSKSVDDMLNAISEIKGTNDEILSQMETSNKEFGEIVKIISEIASKTNVINEIVFQTKLLSFNASVEAARAGEHGKGFAVVAEEVGNLAQMSGNAAKDITDMLSDSIKRVNAIVERTKSRVDSLVEVGKDKITMGQSTAQKCREALNKITENAVLMASMIAEITHASKEQAQGIQEINKAISQLDQVTQQNSAVAQQSSTQAENLKSESGKLSHAISRLVQFVDGTSEVVTVRPKPSIKSKTPLRAKVIPIIKKTKIESKLPPTKASSSPVSKKVAAAQTTPSATDPNFEEF